MIPLIFCVQYRTCPLHQWWVWEKRGKSIPADDGEMRRTPNSGCMASLAEGTGFCVLRLFLLLVCCYFVFVSHSRWLQLRGKGYEHFHRRGGRTDVRADR